MCNELTLGELKEHLGSNITGIRPKSLKEIIDKGITTVIMNGNPDAKDSSVLQVFIDGTVYYRSDGKETLFSICECNNYEYRFSDGTRYSLTEDYMSGLEWHISLIMYAEDKLLHNILDHKKEILWSGFNDDISAGIDDKNIILWEYCVKDYWRSEEERDRVDEILESLCDLDRKIFEMYYFEGLSQYEIACSIGRTRQTVSDRMSSVRKRIQRNLK